MDQSLIAMCGAYCGTYEWKETTNCTGCLAAGGKMFWGICDVAKCAIANGLEHCGLCSEVPRATL